MQEIRQNPQQTLLLDIPVEDIVYDADVSYSVKNSFGSLRIGRIRHARRYYNLSLKDALSCCVTWKNSPEYMVFERLNSFTQCQLNAQPFKKSNGEFEYKFVKASKRGNDVYQYLVSEKFKNFLDVEEKIFFTEDRIKRSPLLFFVLTYDTNRCSADEAWNQIGSEYNLFISNLRKQYGKVSVFRTWEATDLGYPHINVLIYFHDHDFEVFDHIATRGKNKGKQTFRLSFSEMKKISGYWHSHADISGCSQLKIAIKEITKYITEDICSGSKKGNLTIGLLTLYNKQAYAISRDFGEVVCGIKEDLSEPPDLNKEMCNSNFDKNPWEFIGILPATILGISSKIWDVEINEPPPFVLTCIKSLKLEVDRK